MSRFRLSPLAQADLDDIWNYSADSWSIEQADYYVGQIKAACASISPDGRNGRPIDHVRTGYRKLTVGSHFIVFRLVNGDIHVIRILHQRMDISSRLRD